MRTLIYKFTISEKILGKLLIIFCLLLPFQFALNPYPGIDLALARVFILILFFLYIYHAIKTKNLLMKSNWTVILLTIFLFFVLISFIQSENFNWSVRKSLFLFSIAPIFYISIYLFKDKIIINKVLHSLVAGSFFLAIFAVLQFFAQFVFGIDAVYNFLAKFITPFFLGHSFSNTVLTFPSWLVSSNGITYMRAISVFPDPHMLAYYFGMILPWAAYLAVKKAAVSKFYYLIPFLIVLADILTFTRGAYVALIAATIVTLPLVTKKTALKMLGIAFSFILLLQIVPNNPVGGRFASSFDATEGSNHARLSNWQQAVLIIKDNPFGVGIGNYSLHVKSSASYREPIYAHNLYLDIAAEIGIVGALVFISLLATTFFNFYKKAKVNTFYIAGVSSITYFSVHSLVETPLYSVHIFPLLLIILAISTVSHSNENQITKTL